MRGVTLIEVMVAVAIIGIGGGTVFAEVNDYRARVAAVRRGYRALECGEREAEWLKVQPVAALRALAGKPYVPKWCEAPAPPMQLTYVAPAGVFVLELELNGRTVALPFAPPEVRP